MQICQFLKTNKPEQWLYAPPAKSVTASVKNIKVEDGSEFVVKVENPSLGVLMEAIRIGEEFHFLKYLKIGEHLAFDYKSNQFESVFVSNQKV